MGVALKISAAAFILFVGIVLLLLGSIFSDNWWPMLALIPTFLLPPSLMLYPKNDFSDNIGENVWANVSGFLTGAMLLSIFATSIILFHMNMIDQQTFGLVAAGNFVCIFGTGFVYNSVGNNDSEGLL